jgi:hypothetical protein
LVDQSRRDFLRKTAKAGVAVWAVPVITTVRAGPAWAQTQGTGPPTPKQCCTASAYGLRVIIPLLSIDSTFGIDGCLADTGVLGQVGVATVRATAVCGETSKPDGGPCVGSASVASLRVTFGTTVIAATVLGAMASAACAPGCDTAGDSSIVSLNLNGTPINVSSGANFAVGPLIVDEQVCNSGLLTVNALHINVPGIIEVIVSHTVAGATGCPCVTE